VAVGEDAVVLVVGLVDEDVVAGLDELEMISVTGLEEVTALDVLVEEGELPCTHCQ
jgi:hypothetical protein